LERIVSLDPNSGETWRILGHCYLMLDDLPKSYSAYQQALVHVTNPKDPRLWYGIGLLYDRNNSHDNAEEAFSLVLKIDPNFEKTSQVYFRLGVIYKKQGKFDHCIQASG
jgi:glucose repression mediator protein